MTSPSPVAVITGASAGIGAALAHQLTAKGWRVVLAARREAELNACAAPLGAQAVAVVADVTRRADVERIKERALDAFGQIDVWVNNAGRGIGKPILEVTDDDLDHMVTVNVKSVLYGMQTIVPYFQERGSGHLINVSSFLARVPMAPVRAAYSAAKAAVNSLSTTLRLELARSHPGIFVTTVMPGIVQTDFAKNALHGTPPFPGGRPPAVGAPQTAGEVAAAIVGVIERPKAEVYTNPASAGIAAAYFNDPDAFGKP